MISKNYPVIKRILWIILFANFAVAILKFWIGCVIDSQSVMADGIHSFADGTSNIIGLIGIWLACKPKDVKHPYGHGKYEILASLWIGVMLCAMSIRIMSRAIELFQSQKEIEFRAINLIFLSMTILMNTVVAFLEFRWGNRLQSTILVTDSLHTRGDILISCTVLLGLIGIRAGIPVWVDAVLSIVIAVAVLVSAWQIIRNCVDVLVDSAVVDCDEVKNLLITIPGVYDIHQIRSRGENSHVFIDLHVIVNHKNSIVSAHDLSHELESVLKQHYGISTEVNIHMEPNQKFQKEPVEIENGNYEINQPIETKDTMNKEEQLIEKDISMKSI